MADHEISPSSEPAGEPARPPPSAGGPMSWWAGSATAAPALVGALQRTGPGTAAAVLLRLQRTQGNAAVGRMIARSTKQLYTVEEKILDEILNQKRPERLRELFESVPAAKAKQLVDGRLAPTSQDALGVRFNADLSAELRSELIGILRGKYEPKPAPAETQAPDRLQEWEWDPDTGAVQSANTPGDPNYVDNRVTQVARMFGGDDNYLLFLPGGELPAGATGVLDVPGLLRDKPAPVRLEPWRVDRAGSSTAVMQAPFASREAALASVEQEKVKRDGSYHAYHLAVYGMIVPTVFSPSTTPRIAAMIEEVESQRAAEAEAAAEQFTIIAAAIGVGLAGGIIAEAVVGAGLKLATRPKKGSALQPRPAAPQADGAPPPGSTGAMARNNYEWNPKHPRWTPNGPTGARASKAPRDGQAALDNSIQVTDRSPRRVGIDYEVNEFVVFDEHAKGVYHGHVRTWDQLEQLQQNALTWAGMTNRRGKVLRD